MGIVLCHIHGYSGLVEICAHVAKQIPDRKLPSGRYIPLLNLLICDDCFNFLGFEQFSRFLRHPIHKLPDELSDELAKMEEAKVGAYVAMAAAYDAVEGRQTFCTQCIAELDGYSAAIWSWDSRGKST